jgi:hypothetical protein
MEHSNDNIMDKSTTKAGVRVRVKAVRIDLDNMTAQSVFVNIQLQSCEQKMQASCKFKLLVNSDTVDSCCLKTCCKPGDGIVGYVMVAKA